MDPESTLQSASHRPGAGLAPSLERSVTFHNMPLAERGSPYGRSTVPVANQAERILGEIEDSTAILFSSGMTAWTMLCLAALAPGRALAISDGGYYGMETLAGELLEPWGVEVRRYPATDVLWASPECTNHSVAKGVKRATGQVDRGDRPAARQPGQRLGLAAVRLVGPPARVAEGAGRQPAGHPLGHLLEGHLDPDVGVDLPQMAL